MSVGISKGVQHYESSGKAKSQWDITSHLLRWLLPKRQKVSFGEDVEKGNHYTLLMGM